MDIPIHVYKVFNIGGVDVWLTETVVNTWILMAVIILFAVIARIKLTTFNEKPSGLQNVIELIIESMDNFVSDNMSKKYSYFGNWFFGVFVFILVSNLSGLLGFRAPTADLATTAAMGFATFFLIHFMGIFTQKGGYFKSYLEPVPVMLPMNIISEIATPISLSFRLFGNILGGSIIMGLVYSIPYYLPLFFLKVGVPGALHIYFDVFAGVLQTVIFTMLSMIFIKDKIPDEA